MTTARVAGLLLLASALPPSLAAQTSLTIYNDGRVLVRRIVPVAVPKGASTQRVALGALDPASLFSLDSTSPSAASATTAPWTKAACCAAPSAAGSSSASPNPRTRSARWSSAWTRSGCSCLTDGSASPCRAPRSIRAMSSWPTPPPRSGSRARGRRTSSASATSPAAPSWQASYQVVLGGSEARVTGSAVLESQSLRAEDAEMQLLAGAVGRGGPAAAAPMPMQGAGGHGRRRWRRDVSEQRVGEFHLYSLPGKSTLLPGLTTSVALFEPAQVNTSGATSCTASCPTGDSSRSRAMRPRRRSR